MTAQHHEEDGTYIGEEQGEEEENDQDDPIVDPDALVSPAGAQNLASRRSGPSGSHDDGTSMSAVMPTEATQRSAPPASLRSAPALSGLSPSGAAIMSEMNEILDEEDTAATAAATAAAAAAAAAASDDDVSGEAWLLSQCVLSQP